MEEKIICKCGNQEIIKKIKNIEKNLNKNNIKKITPGGIDSGSIITKALPKNPWLSSITGTSIYNLSQIASFNIYFWSPTDNIDASKPNQYIKDNINGILDSLSVIITPENYKSHVKNSFDIYANLLNKTSIITTNYSNSNVVIVFYSNNDNTLGFAMFPETLKFLNNYFDGKIVVFMNNNYISNVNNIIPGSIGFTVLIHEFGHCFGLGHPHDNGANSKIMPGIPFYNYGGGYLSSNDPYPYAGSGGNNFNNAFITNIGYNSYSFYLPSSLNINNKGLPETLMPLDYAAIFYLYNITTYPVSYITNYGVNTISNTNKSKCIIGIGRTITIDSTIDNFIHYLDDAQPYLPTNINPINYNLNRIPTEYSNIYPVSINSRIDKLIFNNTYQTYIFVKTINNNKTIEIKSPQFFMYFTVVPTSIINLSSSATSLTRRITYTNRYIYIIYNPNVTTVNLIY